MKHLALFALLLAQLAPAQQRHVVVISLDGFPASVLRDPNVPFPVLRKLAREGAMADGMKPVNPTVTWPNHTAIISGAGPGETGVFYNGLIVREGDGKSLKVEPWVDKKELVLAPTLTDVARAAGMTTAEVDWVAIYPVSSVTWSFPEQPKPDQAMVKELLADGVIAENEIRDWSKNGIITHDDAWTRAAVHIIEKHKPNLMLMHLLTTDSVQHSY